MCFAFHTPCRQGVGGLRGGQHVPRRQLREPDGGLAGQGPEGTERRDDPGEHRQDFRFLHEQQSLEVDATGRERDTPCRYLAGDAEADETAIKRAQAEDIARLRRTLDSYRAFPGESFSLEGAVDLDLTFHEEFVKASRHNRVLSMWKSFKPQIWFLISSRNACDVEAFRDSAMSQGILVYFLQKGD